MLTYVDAAGRKTTVSVANPLPTSGGGGSSSVQGTYTSTPPTLANGQKADLSLDQRGNLEVALWSGANPIATLTAGGDAASNTAVALIVSARGQVFNGTTWDRQKGDTIGTYVVSKGGASIATAQVAVGTTATQVVAARAGRKSVTLTSTSAFWVGATGVTSTTGFPVAAGGSITLNTAAAVFAVSAAATTVAAIEDY